MWQINNGSLESTIHRASEKKLFWIPLEIFYLISLEAIAIISEHILRCLKLCFRP